MKTDKWNQKVVSKSDSGFHWWPPKALNATLADIGKFPNAGSRSYSRLRNEIKRFARGLPYAIPTPRGANES